MTKQTSGSPARAAVVYNPVKVDIDRVRAAVTAAAGRVGVADILWLETTVEDEGQAQTRQALDAGATLVLAAGGDGTVRAVSEALRGRDAVLAILPSGTGNLLARNIGVTHSSLDDACTIAFAGDTRSIDIGVAVTTDIEGDTNERAFLVMAGVGIDAAMIANTRPRLKRRLGWLAYVDAGFRALPKAKKVRVGYALDGGERRTAHVSTILVANCGSLPGNIELIPDALVDDGLLDIAILQPKSLFGWLLIWRRVTWENRVLRRTALGQRIIRMTSRAVRTELSYLRGRTVQLTVDVPEPFELDGDEFGSVVAVDLTVDPGGLRVRVPAAQ
ncbi:diacylglycerol/lipid kinase family protein [Leifsonia poae]|uniref:diacylglycerol/lipid kinase family protein n=1 Tax=Leifsonia poae TaxID=110933 RepID=UPI001CBEBB9D|nr:diacylglycerol kinase family protein [Leifsonia poae]